MLKIPPELQTQFAQNVIAGNKVNDLVTYTGSELFSDTRGHDKRHPFVRRRAGPTPDRSFAGPGP